MHILIAPLFFLAITMGDAYGLLDSFMIPAASNSLMWRLTSSISAGAMRLERSLNGLVSCNRMRCSTPWANPTSHSCFENTSPLVDSFCLSLFSQGLGSDDSPKSNSWGSITVELWPPERVVIVSVGYTLAITVPAGMEISLEVSLCTSTLTCLSSTAEGGSITGVMNSPAGKLSCTGPSTTKISLFNGLLVSILHTVHISPLDGIMQCPGPIHLSFPSGLSARCSVSNTRGMWISERRVWILRECAPLNPSSSWLKAARRLKKLALVPIMTGSCEGPWDSGHTSAKMDRDSSTPVTEAGNVTSTTM